MLDMKSEYVRFTVLRLVIGFNTVSGRVTRKSIGIGIGNCILSVVNITDNDRVSAAAAAAAQ